MNTSRIVNLFWLAVALALPLFVQGVYQRNLFVFAGIFMILALGLDMVVGYVGELSLGHAGFFGIGTYASALMALQWQTPFLVDFIGAVIITGIFGFLIGYPSLRLTGPYFAIVTFGFAEILQLIALNSDFTRGPMGLPGVSKAQIFGFTFQSEMANYYLVLGVVLICIFVTHRLIRSRTGMAIVAIRENEQLARSMGVNAFRFKMLAFVIGMMFAGAAGSLYVHYTNFTDPEHMGFFYTVTPLTMVLVGGRGSIRGTVIGAVLFYLLPEYLRAAAEWRLSAFGLLIVLAIIFMPEGIDGAIRRLVGWRR
ncbi:MAG: branched-chain amino acid ABC transporter permease, partial [Nitrospinota bacterium]